MGQIFDRQLAEPTNHPNKQGKQRERERRVYVTHEHLLVTTISNISQLPPELALQILKNLNATDLCLAACVWQTLANDEILWLG